MSVAERVPSDDGVTPMAVSASQNSIDNILRLALNGVAGRMSPPPATSRRAEPDFEKAAELLDRATSAIASLTARRDELEQARVAAEEAFVEKLRAAQDEATEWERRAKIMKAQMQDCETRLSEQQIRIETLTYRAENAEARAAMAEQTALEAKRQSQLYHDKIMSALGPLT